MKNKILVLGSSSWLGNLLLNQLNDSTEVFQLASTRYKTMVNFPFNVEFYLAKEPKDYREILSSFKPNSIVNFLRGEDEDGFEIHKDMLT